MREKIRKTIKHPLISGSAIIFFGANLGNVFNFLYNLFMLRNLTSVDYGTLVSLIAIITLFADIADSITPFVVNFAAIYFAMNNLGKAKSLFFKVTKASTFTGLLIFAFFVLSAPIIGNFLKIHNPALIITVGVCVFFGFIGIVNKAFLQAKLAFGYIAAIVFIGSFLKFTSGVFFVWNGFRVQGALFAFIVAFIIPYILSFFPLRKLLRPTQIRETIEFKKMMKFGFGAVLAIFSLTAFITTDVLLVKHFFNPELAGLYAGIIIVGKIVFFFSAPIGSVMFPLIVQKFAKKENYHNDFRLALFLVFFPSLILTALYFLFPEFIIRFVMKRDEYLAGVKYIGFVGIFFSLYSLTYVVTNFYLSIQKTKIFLPIVSFAIAQAVLIWFFHNSLMQVLTMSILTNGLLLFVLLLYYLKLSSSKFEIRP